MPRDFNVPNCPAGEMELRDWFAGMALSGLSGTPGVLGVNKLTVIEACYDLADAMLKERERRR